MPSVEIIRRHDSTVGSGTQGSKCTSFKYQTHQKVAILKKKTTKYAKFWMYDICYGIKQMLMLKKKSTPEFNKFQKRKKKIHTEQCKKWWKSDKNKEVMTFSNFFGKHFLTSPYEYSNERVADVIPSQFSIHFIYRNDKNLIFQLWEYKTCLITTQSKWEIMFTLIHFDMGILFYLYELKIRTGQEVFSEKIWNFKMSYLPYFSSKFHHFFTVL